MTLTRRKLTAVFCASAPLWVSVALAAQARPGATKPTATVPAAAQPAAASPETSSTCIERIPTGRPRPGLSEKVADKALSGHRVTLEVTVEHGKGETVFPGGLRLQFEGEAAQTLEKAGFLLPAAGATQQPTLKVVPRGTTAATTVEVPLLVLAPKPGRHELTLPSLPITVARASGEVLTVCTQPHRIVVDEPIANEPNPRPRDNPPARPQREVWESLQRAVLGGTVGLLAAALLALAIRAWRKRPRRAPPPPPPRPPWEVALEELFDIRNAGLVRAGRLAEHFDRVSDVTRKYLGNVFGFDGLESTTRETLHRLRAVSPRIALLSEIERFLLEADLVKFARQLPTEAQCDSALSKADEIVNKTRPRVGRLEDAAAGPPWPSVQTESKASPEGPDEAAGTSVGKTAEADRPPGGAEP